MGGADNQSQPGGLESDAQFESRKVDHIRIALSDSAQVDKRSQFDFIQLQHEAFPELNFADISLSVVALGAKAELWRTPFFISSMTAGHAGSVDVNMVMARVAAARGWPMGVGSQRRQLHDRAAAEEWSKIRRAVPNVCFFGNIGLAQLIEADLDAVRRLADSLQAHAMIVHTNPLQECLQPEGTPQFRGGLKALENLVAKIKLPVVVKETGCGFSSATLRRLQGLGLAAVDVSGFGGTHWGRVEGERSVVGSVRHRAADAFRDWGIDTVESLMLAKASVRDYAVWASGGVRTGVEAAKLLALGAEMVGLAMPIMQAALNGEEALNTRMETLEFELKTTLFCTGAQSITDLRRAWQASRSLNGGEKDGRP